MDNTETERWVIKLARQKRKEINERKSNRYAEVGLEMEEAIAELLRNATNGDGQPIFEEVVHHQRSSRADLDGKDITVYRKVDGISSERSFGVTISLKRFHKTKNLHSTPVFFTPVGFNPQNLLKKILDLFS